jgi:hypothetical protein
MAISEEDRRQLRIALERQLGHQEAMVSMEHLPPVGWADVATKRDLDVLRIEMGALEARLTGALRREISALQRNLSFGFLTAQAGFAALILGFR